MEGTYPILIKGENCGSLSVSREGAYTRFVAECKAQSGVIRLAVYGGGREGYLGVPLPRDGKLYLDKRLSPAAMKAFPDNIELCALAGEKREEAVPEQKHSENDSYEEDGRNCPQEQDEESATLWYATADGALVSREGDREMVALPPDDERVPKNFPGQPRIIDGKEYLVYITREM